MKPLSRRALLGANSASVALPWLEAFGQPAGFPRRLLIVFTANGTLAEHWRPGGGVTDFTFSRLLRPLEARRSKLLILEGIDCESANHGPGNNGHDLSMGHLLTATALVPGPQGAGAFGHLVDGSAGGPSVDQYIASRLNAGTRFQSLEFGVRAQNIFMPLPSRLVYRGRFQPVQPENNPRAMFTRLFGTTVDPDPNGARALRTKRQLAFDRVKDDFRAMRSKVGVEDQRRLDAHAQALVEVERRAVSLSTFSCQVPGMPAAVNGYREEGALQMELIKHAFACDLTRVATLQWSTAQSGATFPWLGFSEYHHELSHAGDSDAVAQEKLNKIDEWYAQQFNTLLGHLDSVVEGTGTLLDNTCVVWVNELGRGNNHTHMNIPIVMAGGWNGHFRMNRYLRFANTKPHNDFFLSLIEGMGLTPTTFGDPQWCTGPIASLRA
jgi:hypothetical protein